MSLNVHVHHYVIAGMSPDNIAQCQVFTEYDGASTYAKVLLENNTFPYICVRKQACIGETVEFQDCWAVQR